MLAHRLIAFLSGDQIRFFLQKSQQKKTNNQTAGDRKALCCCLLRLVKQRLIGLGPKNGFKNNSLGGIRCMFMGRQVYVCGAACSVRCTFVGGEVYKYGALGVCLWGRNLDQLTN